MLFAILLRTTRPNFLVLSVICIFLGVGVASTKTSINTLNSILVFIGALLSHISVNTLNEYHDFKSGLDELTRKTPFSGGSGALPNNPRALNYVLFIALSSILLVAFIGIYFISILGFQILPVGIMGIVIILSYTKLINRLPFLCLIAPGTGFGLLMVNGADIILSGYFSLSTFYISLIPFFLTNNILLLNQYPDIKSDMSVGRRTFPIIFGIKNSNAVYAVFTILTYALIIIYMKLQILPAISIIALLPCGFSIYSLFGAIKYKACIKNKYLGTNVIANIATITLLGLVLVV